MNLRHHCLVLVVAASMLATDAPKASSVEGTVTLNSLAPSSGSDDWTRQPDEG